jgi:hypothetical protein
MTVGVGAAGFLGVAVETTAGTYVAPTNYAVLRNENIQFNEAKSWRRPLRGIADIAGALRGGHHVEGDITIELTHDEFPFWLRGTRGSIAKSGAGPYTYVWTPNANALPAKTLSITVVRNGVVFGFVGCVIGNQTYTIDNGVLVATFHIVGTDEASQSLPTPTHVTTEPFQTGEYSLQIPTSTQVFDADTFTLGIDDAAEPQFRIKNTRSAQFTKYGERAVTLSIERDFEARTDYDAFKALTAQSITLVATKGANTVTFLVPAAIKDTYEITGMSGQAELIRASIAYQGVYNSATSKAAEITVVTTANITVP